AALVTLTSVNSVSPEAISSRLNFESRAHIYPAKRLITACGKDDIAGRMIDILSPLAAGQRAFVIAPHGTGKTSVLKGIAKGLEQNQPEVKIIFALIDARPEEAADFKRSFKRVDVIASTMDAGAHVHIKTAEIALEYAKRQAELCRNVVFILDDVAKLTRAYNSGSQVNSALDTAALDAVKKFISSARNTEAGASLTVIATLPEGGDAIEDAIYSGLKDFCNMRVTLSQKLARFKVNPPIDIENTLALGDERILPQEEQSAAVKLRKIHEQGESVIHLFESTASNKELCKVLK
ncbi:MAG: AAA family ATPase, partial [Clostridia bacterium]|nr:AAA family ATPase [Clostridia bacterium]